MSANFLRASKLGLRALVESFEPAACDRFAVTDVTQVPRGCQTAELRDSRREVCIGGL